MSRRSVSLRTVGVVAVVVTAVVLVGVGTVPTAEAATTVDQCREINESVVPGDRTVLLNQSISASGTCFEVTTSDVTLDGQGNTVTGSGSSGVGVLVANSSASVDNVTVRNVAVTGFEDGVRADDSATDLTVRDTNVSNNAGTGVDAGARATLDNVTASNNEDGLFLRGADSTVVDATVTGNTFLGVGVSADDVVVERASVTDGNTGIRVYSGDSGATVRDSTLQNTDALVQSTDNRFDNVTVDGASFAGVTVEAANNTLRGVTVTNAGDDGVLLDGADDTRLVGSTIDGSTASGVNVTAATNVTIQNTAVVGSGDDGIVSDSASTGLTVRDTNVSNNAGTGVDAGARATLDNVTASNNEDGLFLRGADSTVVDATVTGNTFLGVGVSADDVVVERASVTDGNTGIRVYSGDSGATVRDSTLQNTDALVQSTDNRFDNVTVDGASFAGVTVEAANNTLRGVTVTNAGDDGVLLDGADDTRLVDATVDGATAGGVNVTAATNVTLDNVTAVAAGSNGVRLDGATGVTVVASNVSNNSIHGVTGLSGSEVAVRDTLVANNGFNGVDAPAMPTTLDNVTVRENAQAGISTSSATTVRDSRIVGNAWEGIESVTPQASSSLVVESTVVEGSTGAYPGILVANFGSVTVADTEVRDVNGTGVDVQRDVRAVTDGVYRNVTVTNVTGDGIRIDGGTNSTVAESNVTGADAAGINVTDADDTTVHDTVVVGNNLGTTTQNAGILVSGSDDVRLTANEVHDNRIYGVLVQRAVGTYLGDTEITENCGGTTGLRMVGVDETVVENTNVSNNTGTGAVFDGTGFESSLTVRDSNFDRNGGDGIQIVDVGNEVVDNVTANRNDFEGMNVQTGLVAREVTVAGNDDDGINAGANLTVRNGVIEDNGGDGIDVAGNDTTVTDTVVRNNDGYGIDAEGNVTVRDTVSENNTDDGIYVDDNVTVVNVSLLNNGGWGIDAESHVSIRDVRAVNNDDEGIEVEDDVLIQNVVVRDNDDEGVYGDDNVTVRNAVVENNTYEGIYVSDNATLVNVTIRDNDGYGAEADDDSVARDVISTGNDGDGIYFDDRARIENVTVRDNEGWGVDSGDGSVIRDALAVNNTDEGLEVEDDSLVENVVVRDGSDYGVQGGINVTVRNALVENNTDAGIIVEGDSTLANVAVRDNTVDVAIDGPGTQATDLTLGDTRLAAARLANVDLNATDAGAAPAPPGGLSDVRAYVEMTNRTTSAYADVTVAYTDASASGVDESTLALYHHDGTTWSAVGGSTANPAANTVRANATAFSVFAPFGAAATAGGDDTTGPTGEVTVTDASLSTTAIDTGESVTVSATVENTQGTTAAKALGLHADGVSVGQRTVYVPGNTAQTYEFTYAPSRTGEYDVTVNGLDAGTLTVSEPATGGGGGGATAHTPTPTDDGTTTPTDGSGDGTTTPTDGSGDGTTTPTATATPPTTVDDTPTAANAGGSTSTPTAGGGPGFGLVAALVALLGAALLVVRRW